MYEVRKGNRIMTPNFADSVLCNTMPSLKERTALEAQHRNKINAEINRYQAMVQEKEELNRKWDEEVRVTLKERDS